MEVCVV